MGKSTFYASCARAEKAKSAKHLSVCSLVMISEEKEPTKLTRACACDICNWLLAVIGATTGRRDLAAFPRLAHIVQVWFVLLRCSFFFFAFSI